MTLNKKPTFYFRGVASTFDSLAHTDARSRPTSATRLRKGIAGWAGIGTLLVSMAATGVLAQTPASPNGASPSGQSSMGNPLNQNPARRDAELPGAAASAPVVEPDPRNSTSRPTERQTTSTPDPRNSTSRPTPPEPGQAGRPAGEVD